jgi:inorganic pyrophosphatase
VEVRGWHDAAYARDRVLQAARNFTEHKEKKLVEADAKK